MKKKKLLILTIPFFKILNIKNNQFERNLFNSFLERAKQGKSFDNDRYNEVI